MDSQQSPGAAPSRTCSSPGSFVDPRSTDRSSLVGLDKSLFEVHKIARGEVCRTSLSDYWDAVMIHLSSSESTAPDEETGKQTVTETEVTPQGIVYKSSTLPDPGTGDGSPPPDIVVAVGIGEQILPGKGGPVFQEESLIDVATQEGQSCDSRLGGWWRLFRDGDSFHTKE